MNISIRRSWVLFLLIGLLLSPGGVGWAQKESADAGPSQPGAPDVLAKILEFIYTASHALGEFIMSAVRAIFPDVGIPATLVDAIGFLSLLTATLVVAEIARKLVWFVVGIGWLLIVIRVAMIVLQGS
jgi:hypothetical protein